MTDPTAPSDADLIVRLRRRAEMFNEADVDHEAGELDMATADRIEALSAGNSRLVKLLDQAEANAIVEHEAWQAAQTESHKLVERAEARLAEREATIATVKAFADQNRKSTSTARLVIAGDLDPILSAAPGDALSARLAEVERQRDRAERQAKNASAHEQFALRECRRLRDERDRAEQCIEQVREWVEAHPVLDGLIDEPVAFLAAYDAARETPEGV